MAGNRSSNKNVKINPIIIVIIIVVIALLALIGFNLYLANGEKPIDPGNKNTVAIEIPQGSGTESIAVILSDHNLIDSVTAFKFQSKFNGKDGQYKAGNYVLSPGMSMNEMMDIIIEGKQDTKRFTIPEGYDLKRTSEKLAKEGFIDPAIFQKEIEFGKYDYKFLKDAPQGPNRLEGYLYPETYDVFDDATEKDIIKRMLGQFDKMFTKEYYVAAKEQNMDINEVLTLASLIERETRVKDEKIIVSSVIKNRMAIGMPLQIDATIQYALGEQKERLFNEDLKINSPYNTYTNKGLPPGPICSPGIDSIYAALHPADTQYLYYVLDPSLNGTHLFSNDYNEFLKNKENYIKKAFGN